MGFALLLAGVSTLDRSHTTKPIAVPQFVKTELGARRPSAHLTRTTAPGTTTKIVSSGYEVANSTGTVRVTQAGDTSTKWVRYANGTTRPTSYGNETIVLGGKQADGEQYVTVGKHAGVHTWKWQLSTGSLQPTLRADGSVLVSPAHVVGGFRILPLAIFDTHCKNVTPRGAAWGLEHKNGSWQLTLNLDDSRLPVPYVIDPAVETFRSVNSANTAGGATTVLITKPAGLVQNDLMVAAISVRGGSNTFVCAPVATGAWTSFLATNSTTNLHQELFWKVASAADVAAANYTFTFGTVAGCGTTSSQVAVGGIAAFYGINDAAPIGSSGGQANASGTNTIAPTINNATINNFLVGAFGSRNTTTYTPPPGLPTFTEQWDTPASGGVTLELATAVTTATGATGTKTATPLVNTAVNVGQLFTLAIDGVPPTNAIAVTSAAPAGSSFLSGTNVYYRGAALGSFQLQDTVTETGSGVASVVFPALGGTTTGWTHLTDSETTPVGGPYVTTNNFSWTAGTVSGPTDAVVATDNATNPGTTNLTFVNDSTAPTGGTISVPANSNTLNNIVITTANYTDAGSGLAAGTNVITRSNAQLPSIPGVSCPAGGYVGATVVPTSPDTVPTDGMCYVYTLTGTDNVGNTATVTSSPILVDTSVPTATAATAGVSSLTFAATVPNKAMRMLVVGVEAEFVTNNSCQASGVTYGGTAMTEITSAATGTGSYDCSSLWYMAAPPVGTANVIVTYTGTFDATAGAVALWNVKQGAPDAFNSSFSNTAATTTSLTTVTPNSTVIDIFGSGQPTTVGALVPNAGQTAREITTLGGTASTSHGMSTELVPAPGAVTVGWTQSGINRSTEVAAAFAPGDVTPPTNAFSVTGSAPAGSSFLTGTTVYYRGVALAASSSKTRSPTPTPGRRLQPSTL